MKIGIKQRLHGRLLFLALAFLLLSGCRRTKPPKISIICMGDGFGGADCVTGFGEKRYLGPSQLKNFWMTTEVDQANFSSWCYDTSPSMVTPAMNKIKTMALDEPKKATP